MYGQEPLANYNSASHLLMRQNQIYRRTVFNGKEHRMHRLLALRFRPSRPIKGLIFGVVVGLSGVLLAMTPAGRWLEEELGLVWLFQLRGPIPPPSDVVIISIDQASSKQLGLPNKPRLWPRLLHAQLVDKLRHKGAAVIFFDMIFEEQRDPSQNQYFAAAIKQANNVILFQYLYRETLSLPGGTGAATSEAHIERLISPLPELRDAAFGLAPFPLPKVPAKVNHFVLFKPELGQAPTMPVTVLQAYALPVYDELLALLQTQLSTEEIRSLPASSRQLRQTGFVHHVSKDLYALFARHPALASALIEKIKMPTSTLTPAQRALLRAVIEAYQMPASAYLNFYGPPRSITTIPYYQVLQDEGDTIDLTGKAVFVGFSEELQPEQKDGFYTVYTDDRSGLDISGVEIGATAFANLLQRQSIRTPNLWLDIFLLLGWGMLLGNTLRWLTGAIQIPMAMLLGAGYFSMCYAVFTRTQLWLPLSIPLLWQLPLATVGALLWQYLDVQRERRNIRQAFGYHLPIAVVDQLAKGVEHISAIGQHVHGIVLATDAEQYTTLSEKLHPGELRELMNRYYQTVFTPIRAAQGVISDVIGDAVLAIWAAAHDDTARRSQACAAALSIRSAVNKFNIDSAPLALPTRIGLHCGEVVMGHVGALDHYEYRAVGDIVNTATRIEGLNKQLGTRILVSAAMLDGVTGFVTREVGRFRLAGKQQTLTLHELIGATTDASRPPIDQFVDALRAFQTQHWSEAQAGFTEYLQQHGEDGPSRYYLRLCQQYIAHPPPTEWDGTISLVKN